jgi:hypothetical protein
VAPRRIGRGGEALNGVVSTRLDPSHNQPLAEIVVSGTLLSRSIHAANDICHEAERPGLGAGGAKPLKLLKRRPSQIPLSRAFCLHRPRNALDRRGPLGKQLRRRHVAIHSHVLTVAPESSTWPGTLFAWAAGRRRRGQQLVQSPCSPMQSAIAYEPNRGHGGRALSRLIYVT